MLHKFTILVGIFMVLGSVLLWQRSAMVHVAYRQSGLAQEKKILLKEIHRLEVEVRKLKRPQILYQYWQKHQDAFDFKIQAKEVPPAPKESKTLIWYAGFKKNKSVD